MEIKVTTLDGKDAGNVTLTDEIFGLEPRQDILHRVVRYQLAKAAGTHKAKDRAEASRTGAKMYKQKGTGGARHHSARAPQFRGGGKAHGPVVRRHEHRPAQEGPRARPEACAVGQGQVGSSDHRHRRVEAGRGQDQGAGCQVSRRWT